VLNAITVLKKICDHPALLTNKAASLALTASKRGPRKNRRGGSSSDSDDSSYYSLDDFIADDPDEEAGSVAEAGEVTSSERWQREDIEGQLERAGESLGQEFKDMLEGELLEKLHSKSVKESCKTVRLLMCRANRLMISVFVPEICGIIKNSRVQPDCLLREGSV
jgi:SNF2 family DNA or RNA helicase